MEVGNSMGEPAFRLVNEQQDSSEEDGASAPTVRLALVVDQPAAALEPAAAPVAAAAPATAAAPARSPLVWVAIGTGALALMCGVFIAAFLVGQGTRQSDAAVAQQLRDRDAKFDRAEAAAAAKLKAEVARQQRAATQQRKMFQGKIARMQKSIRKDVATLKQRAKEKAAAARQDGVNAGYSSGKSAGYSSGYSEGNSSGYTNGYSSGYTGGVTDCYYYYDGC